MARDRLAAVRNQGSGYPQRDNSYPTQPAQYDSRRYDDGGRGFTQQPNQYEMTNYSNGALASDDMSAFYQEISSIQEEIRVFNNSVSRISDLHDRSLNSIDEDAMHRENQQLDNLVDETRGLSGQLKKRIQDLERKGGSGRDGQIRKQQTGLVKAKFVEAIQAYQEVEKNYRARYKARLERQFKIVKPNATQEEVKAVVNNDQGGQIFQQALMNSNKYGETKAAYREVQERHKDIIKIEQTITELAQLFQDMSILVNQQDETLNVIETHAQQVNTDTEAGLRHTEAAVVSARAARKKRWICFFIIVIILIIVGVVVGIVVHNNIKK